MMAGNMQGPESIQTWGIPFPPSLSSLIQCSNWSMTISKRFLVSKQIGQQWQNQPNSRGGLASQALIPSFSVRVDCTVSVGEATGTHRMLDLLSETGWKEESRNAFPKPSMILSVLLPCLTEGKWFRNYFIFNIKESSICLEPVPFNHSA